MMTMNIKQLPGFQLGKAAASGSDEYKEKSKKVKYVMVQTLKDGSQVRKTLRPDDPILKTVPVTRSKVNSLDKFRRSLPISPPKPSSKIISTKKPYEGFSLNRSLPGRSSSDRNSKHHYERNESASNARSQSPVSTYRNKRISPPRESNYDNHNSYFKNNTKKPFYNKRKY
ncbi:unnamed protein product [Lepeophtheirus salmonis]|uniref:(salmon louse) hypothetical protein n=1 Tax=Lepeophtheirus salmonis TaxID=72036 RepID=A0A7R8D8T6_LEPSM|nr:unnamed protein product [Lepeophtheirus salmonis]CAF3037560.1 unnamed protein product [Lepeophtheirus salmonis]